VIRQLTRLNRQASELAECTFRSDVLAGLSADPKWLACKYFYDRRGSELFDAICRLDEYYLSRVELQVMSRFAPEIARAIGAGVILIEFGSGSSVKTRRLLNHLDEIDTMYVPVDISFEHLLTTSRRLARRYPKISIQPVAADFTADFKLPSSENRLQRRIVYFPGSTIGNFEYSAAVALLGQISKLCGQGGGLLIGIDLQKDVATIEAAYNDAQGITAKFNLNLLARINRELGGNFNLAQFVHSAFYDIGNARVDIRLVSCCDQNVEIGSDEFEFRAGEPIQTEFSHKYTIEGFEQMAAQAGLRLEHCWTDDRRYFAVLYFGAGGTNGE
jgi:dimethylhistidine N-methyltransferase